MILILLEGTHLVKEVIVPFSDREGRLIHVYFGLCVCLGNQEKEYHPHGSLACKETLRNSYPRET